MMIIGSELQERSTSKKAGTRSDFPFEPIPSLSSSTSEDNNTRKRPSEEDSACLQSFWKAVAILAFFVILDCLLIALLVTVSVNVARLRQNSPSSSSGVKNVSISTTASESTSGLLEDSAFCLPCSDVYLSEVEILQNRRSRVRQRKDEDDAGLDGGALLCCAEPHDDLKTLVGDMFIRIRYGRDRARGVVKVAANDTDDNDEEDDQSDVIKPHILLQLDTEADPKEVNGRHAVPLMMSKREAPSSDPNQNSSSAFLREGVVKIAHPGHFYIHSLVPFTYHLDHPVILTQYVYRVRNGGETLLLENSVYPCDVRVQNCEHSFVGGLFLLERGDEVVLQVSNHSYVAKERELEFGVHRL